jgi:hypothetical protein
LRPSLCLGASRLVDTAGLPTAEAVGYYRTPLRGLTRARAPAPHEQKKVRLVCRTFHSPIKEHYFVSLPGEAVNSLGLATGRVARLTNVGAPAAAP